MDCFACRHRWKRSAIELNGRFESRYRHDISGLLMQSYSEVSFCLFLQFSIWLLRKCGKGREGKGRKLKFLKLVLSNMPCF